MLSGTNGSASASEGPDGRRIRATSAGEDRTWAAAPPGVDARRWAALLRRAHTTTIERGRPPTLVRDVVARSWRRSLAADVDPDQPSPRVLSDANAADELSRHPFGRTLGALESQLFDATHALPQLVALSDAGGTLLWVDGHPDALRFADAPRFLPGFSCGESAVGTNAAGTALAVDHPVQIFSAEHFNRLLHGWTCAAAPVHDPATGRAIGAVNLSGSWTSSHAHTVVVAQMLAQAFESAMTAAAGRDDDALRGAYLSQTGRPVPRGAALVGAAGRVVLSGDERWLAQRVQRDAAGVPTALADGRRLSAEPFRDGFLVALDGILHEAPPVRMGLAADGDRRLLVTVDGRPVRLRPRLSDLLLLLLRHPSGLSAEQLARLAYARPVPAVTVRAELSRLRALLGPAAVGTRPYRVQAELVPDGLPAGLLPASEAPGLGASRAA